MSFRWCARGLSRVCVHLASTTEMKRIASLAMSRTSPRDGHSKFARITRGIGLRVAICATVLFGCEGKPPRLVVTEETVPGENTLTVEYRNGATHVVSRVAHSYNTPTGDRSESGDSTAVFRAMTGKELAEAAAVRSASAFLATLEKEGVKLTAEPGGKVEENPMAPRVRAFTVGR